jgi:hypothetical protein
MANGQWQMEKKLSVHFPFSIFHFPSLLLVAILAGCASDKHPPTTQPSSVRDRQEAALNDPMGYSPNMNSRENDISGGKLNELDRGALKKDIDHVLNP